jgi:hypothetical protein
VIDPQRTPATAVDSVPVEAARRPSRRILGSSGGGVSA